jgi:hypothetical protein
MIKTQKIVPIGRILSQEQGYFLINPHPLPADWEVDGLDHRFLVVPWPKEDDFTWTEIDGKFVIIYPCPREVVFCCSFQVEYATDISTINCELPYDVIDRENDLITTEIGE